MLRVDVSWVKNHSTRSLPRLKSFDLGGGRYANRRFIRRDVKEFIQARTEEAERKARSKR